MIKEIHNSNFPLPDKNILMISFTSFLQKFYQTLPAEIAKQSGARVKILVPIYWKELWSSGKIYLEKKHDPNYEIITGKILFTGNLHFAFFITKIKKLLQTFKPDIIDLEDEPFNTGTFQLVFYSKLFSPRSKIVLHASQHQYKNYPLPFNLFEKYTLKHSDAIMVRNSMAKKVLERKGYKGRLEIITHGVDTEAFKPLIMSHKDNDTKTVIGYVGSLVEQKGINHLFQAACDLKCKILIVGDGPEKENLTKLSQDLKIDVQFEPAASHKQVAGYMNQMDIFVLPSLTRPNWVEKFGRVLIEAMACGVPVVGSSSGEIPNVIGKAGLIFKEGNIDDLHDKLDLLLSDKDLRNKLGKLGREKTVKHYSWRSIAGQTINLYEQLLDPQNHQP
jgi:glycosyltransferase involved in cell wall biosynthesis